MKTPDHLHPARPEYLRRGTPVLPRKGGDRDPSGDLGVVVRLVTGGAVVAFDWHDRAAVSIVTWMLSDLRLDLRDPTARAHAAMAWTDVRGGPDVVINDEHCRAHCSDREHWRFILSRMRALDETVTTAEARAALMWAESMVSP